MVLFACSTRPAWGMGDYEASSYTGILLYPTTVGGITLLNYDRVIGGVKFEFCDDRLGLEVNLLTGLIAVEEEYWDEIDHTFYSDLPVILSLGVLAYPIRGRILAAYITTGLGGALIDLELDDPYLSGLHAFWSFSAGTGIKCYLEEGERGVLYLESRRYLLLGDEPWLFQLHTFSFGYGIAF